MSQSKHLLVVGSTVRHLEITNGIQLVTPVAFVSKTLLGRQEAQALTLVKVRQFVATGTSHPPVSLGTVLVEHRKQVRSGLYSLQFGLLSTSGTAIQALFSK